MKKLKCLIFILFLLIPVTIKAETINAYLFYGDGCPHCKHEEEFFNEYLLENHDVTLTKFEVWGSSENRMLLSKVQDKLNNHESGVPYLVIGSKAIIGFSEGISDKKISNTIDNYRNSRDYEDVVGKIINDEEIGIETKDEKNEVINPSYNKKEVVNKKDNNKSIFSIIIDFFKKLFR